jgi:hypothetical protein
VTPFSRRSFVKGAAAAGALPARAQGPVLYFVDGYHGGSRGHMPPGSWRDILNRLRDFPDWKLSLEVEPDSWDDLRREDPEAYREIKQLLADRSPAARLRSSATPSHSRSMGLQRRNNIRR